MNILYTCDNNYIWIMGISMISVFENNKSEKEITIYLLGDNITAENKELLINIAQDYRRKCVVIDVSELNIPAYLCSTRWPKSAFSRLYAGELLPHYIKKILYLDCDTIVLSKIGELWNINIDKQAVSGVKDCIGKAYLRNIGLVNDAVYVNAGVLLMNLDLMRNIDVSSKIEDFLYHYSKSMHYADQDILNGIFKGNFGVLPAQYDIMTLMCTYNYREIIQLRHPSNYYSKKEIQYALNNPKIIHFTTCMLSVRPWYENSEHPYGTDFLKYKLLSPWSKYKLLQTSTSKNTKNKILKFIFKLPKTLRNTIIGLMHSILYPYYIKIKSIRK